MSIMSSELGLIHVYCGDGKGKTTAAMGLALRMLGCDNKVCIVQFLKDGNSSELKALSSFKNAAIFSGKEVSGFSFSMSEEEKKLVTNNHNDHLKNAIKLCKNDDYSLLILDEAIGAINAKMLDYTLLVDFIKNKPPHLEIVLTGRKPSDEILSMADYVSEIKKIKHPYDSGIAARMGIEL